MGMISSGWEAEDGRCTGLTISGIAHRPVPNVMNVSKRVT